MKRKFKGSEEPELRAVYARMAPELVAWLDSEAKRQRRSRAYVISQSVRVLRSVLSEFEQERRV